MSIFALQYLSAKFVLIRLGSTNETKFRALCILRLWIQYIITFAYMVPNLSNNPF